MELSKQDKAFLASYDNSQYEKPSVCADTALFRVEQKEKMPAKLQLLLIQRGAPPYAGGWALPGGFCDMSETLAQTAARELYEETGLTAYYAGQVQTLSTVERDPRGRNISTVFLAALPKDSTSGQAGDDAAHLAWFDVDFQVEINEDGSYRGSVQLSNEEEKLSAQITAKASAQGFWQREGAFAGEKIAFDHSEAIIAAVAMLKNRVWQTDLAFQWVDKIFSLMELQEVYEAVFQEEMLRTTFYKHIKAFIKRYNDADEMSEQLYEKNQAYRYDESTALIPFWL